ncbi:glutamyl-tRNA reductase [Alicyclobacillaceae bacterium I2511]|nr:glutamyl-tRNA reductase [Alicyclobacillaceae bacterium I2511]
MVRERSEDAVDILVVGVSDKTCPVALREQVSVLETELGDIYTQLLQNHTLFESVILSTCNRTEIYAIVSSLHAGEDYLRSWFDTRAKKMNLSESLYVYHGEKAVAHLMQVACSLDSMVLGETQILGQVRQAYGTAKAAGSVGVLLDNLFRRALQVGKRAQSETTIGQNAVSISYAAVQLAKKIFGNLNGQKVLLIGAGKNGYVTAQTLTSNGPVQMWVTNRTLSRSQTLATEFGAQAVAWGEFQNILSGVDIVLSSTAAKSFVLSSHQIARAMHGRVKPMVLIDIAVPRDIDPGVGKLPNTYLYDIDDLRDVVEANLTERRRQTQAVQGMINQAIREFSDWLSEQEVIPLITAVREKGIQIQASIMDSLHHKLPNLDERELRIIQKHTMSIVNQLLRDPIQNMKELAVASDGVEQVKLFAELFGISADEILNNNRKLQTHDESQSDARDLGFSDLVHQWSDVLRRDVVGPNLGGAAHSIPR